MPTSLSEAVFLVVDTETTGLNAIEDRVCEIAGIRTDLTGDVGRPFESLVNPGRGIPPEASAIHHLTNEDVAHAPHLEVVLPLLTWEHFDCWVAHNAAFDFSFLPAYNRPVLCTLRLARKLLPELPKHGNQYLRYALPLAVPAAKGLLAHRALADVFVTTALLRQLLGELARQHPQLLTIEAVVAFANEPILMKTCRFGHKYRDKPWSEVPKDYLRWMIREVQILDPDTRFTVEHWLRN